MRVCLVFVAIALGSCAPQTQYIRADGRYASEQSIQGARTECGSEFKDSLCMVEKGYFSVSADQAEAKRAQLAAIAEANEQERQAKLAAQAARAAEQVRKEALEKKKRKRTPASSASSVSSPWPLR